MPQKNGTGPAGLGPLTGRGMGVCATTEDAMSGNGLGCGLGRRCGSGRGLGRRFAVGYGVLEVSKELLEGQKSLLQKKIEMIGKQLENL